MFYRLNSSVLSQIEFLFMWNPRTFSTIFVIEMCSFFSVSNLVVVQVNFYQLQSKYLFHFNTNAKNPHHQINEF